MCLEERFSELTRSLKKVRLLWKSRGDFKIFESGFEKKSRIFQIKFRPSFKLNSENRKKRLHKLDFSAKSKHETYFFHFRNQLSWCIPKTCTRQISRKKCFLFSWDFGFQIKFAFSTFIHYDPESTLADTWSGLEPTYGHTHHNKSMTHGFLTSKHDFQIKFRIFKFYSAFGAHVDFRTPEVVGDQPTDT